MASNIDKIMISRNRNSFSQQHERQEKESGKASCGKEASFSIEVLI